MKAKLTKTLCTLMICVLMLALTGCPNADDSDTTEETVASASGTEQTDTNLDAVSSGDTDTESLVSSVNSNQNTSDGENDAEEETETEVVLPEYTPVDPDMVEENVEGDFIYTLEDDTATITGYTGTASQVKIPESLGGSSKTVIGKECFKENADITYVYISSTVTEIESYAFYACEALEEVYIADCVKSIRTIAGNAFGGCTALRRIEIGGNSDYTINDTVISAGALTLGGSVFSGCTSLTEVVFPETLSSLGDYAFDSCSSLKTIDLSNTLLSGLGDQCFSYCTSLQSVAMPSTMGGEYSLCTNAFIGCSSLSEMTFPNGNSRLEVVDGILYEYTVTTDYIDGEWVTELDGGMIVLLALGGYDNENVVIRDGTTKICNNAFEYNKIIKTLTIPDSVKTIERLAFCGCSNLESVDFGNGVELIAQSAFESCGFVELDIPESVTELVNNAFAYCKQLERVSLPDNITYGTGATTQKYVFANAENAIFTYKGVEYTYEQAEELDIALGAV